MMSNARPLVLDHPILATSGRVRVNPTKVLDKQLDKVLKLLKKFNSHSPIGIIFWGLNLERTLNKGTNDV